ncbi:MAG: hypothetical protein V4714_17725 [Bacteroidota bacterium]
MNFPEKHRIKSGYPMFEIRTPFHKKPLTIIATDGLGWDHVSVSLPTRCPNWEEMCMVKALFWSDEEAVMQLHPPKSDHVNNHPYCLHLWKPQSDAIPLPNSLLVGLKGLEIKL